MFYAADTSKSMFCEIRLNFFKPHYTVIKEVHVIFVILEI